MYDLELRYLLRGVARGWALAFTLAIATQAQDQAARQTPPNFRVESKSVLLDVVAVDKAGHPVRNLSASDFMVMEDGLPQKIVSFEQTTAEQRAKSPLPTATKLPPNTFTNYDPLGTNGGLTAIVLSTPGYSLEDLKTQSYLRAQLLKLLEKAPAGTPVALFGYEKELRLLHGFTTDLEGLKQAVEHPGNVVHITPYGDNRESPQEMLLRMNQYLSAYPGRKTLIWFHSFVPVANEPGQMRTLFPETINFFPDLQGAAAQLTLNRIALYLVDPVGLKVYFPRPHDPNAFVASNWEMSEHMAMDQAARAAGGRAFYNRNDLAEATREAMECGSNYYTLSYTPTNKKWDGGYRKIVIKAKDRSLRLEYRNGYYAVEPIPPQTFAVRERVKLPRPYVAPSAAPQQGSKSAQPELAQAMSFGSLPSTAVVFSATVTPGRGVAKLAKGESLPPGNHLTADWSRQTYSTYQIHYSLQPDQLTLAPEQEGRRYRGLLQVTAVVYDEAGEIVNSGVVQTPVNITADERRQILEHGLGLTVPIAVPVKGNFFLRLAVEDMPRRAVGSLEIPLQEVQMLKADVR